MKLTDLSSAASYEDPYPLYRSIRAEGPLTCAGPNMFVSARYATIEALLHDRRLGKDFLASVRARYGEAGLRQPAFQAINRMFLMMNPPAHTRLRSTLMKAFNARQVESLRRISQSTVDRLIDSFVKKGRADLVREFALRVPVEIICALLGIPVEHAVMLASASSDLVQALDAAPLDASRLRAVNKAYQTLDAYFTPAVEARRARPRGDLISALATVEDDGEMLSDAEVLSNVILLFVAGHETTSNMIGNALISLHRHPQQLELLRSDPSRIGRAVAECMRFDASVQMVARTAFEDIEFAGVTLSRNTSVFMLLGAANRDPEQFTDPDRLDIDREQGRPVGFGGGIHYCLGSRLATLELEVAIGTLLERLPDFRLVNLDALRWHQRHNLRGVESLIAAW